MASEQQPAGAKPAKPDRPEKREGPEKRERPERKGRTSRRRSETRRAPLPAAKRELLFSVGVTERQVAVLEDDRVAEVYLERPGRRSIAGNIYLGTVDNVLPGMEAAFVDIGLERNGFLFVDEIVTPELEGRRHGKKIQDLLSRGQQILVQTVKDPMKSKGARLTTEISLAGRFVVYVPSGEGFGVSRRLEDEERTRLRDILKSLDVKKGGLIVRTAAEGASAEDIERDFDFLQRLWKTIEQRAKVAPAPAIVYQEAELPLRVTRDLFTEDFERALVDDDQTYRRVVGYLKKTSPHMAERVTRYREKQPLMEAFGVHEEIRSTLSRRVDLPSGGSLIFDYAEAFTVIDVNTGRFVGSRSKSSASSLEDTITKNNIEAVKEVVRQLRLRDIGGIVVIDFIDMANPKNRATVEEALRTELQRDRTKTYVVEISPLGLVEMTRQNVTDGPREILAKKCPMCAGDGIVVSETTATVDVERRLRTLVRGSRSKVFRVEMNAHVAAILVGPGAQRLAALEEAAKRRFVLVGLEDVPLDHLVVVSHGAAAEPEPAPVEEGKEVSVKLVEVGLHDARSAAGKLDGLDVSVADAARLVGKKVRVRVTRFMEGTVYATLVSPGPRVEDPITAEAEAERPTRARRRVKAADAQPLEAVAEAAPESEPVAVSDEPEEVAERPTRRRRVKAVEAEAPAAVTEAAPGPEPVTVSDEPESAAEGESAAEPPAKRKTRRGTRGGRGRKRKTPSTMAMAENGSAPATEEPAAARIHLPPAELGGEDPVGRASPETAAPVAGAEGESPDAGEADGASKPRRKTRRGTRGGRNRRKKTASTAAAERSAETSSGE
ncbi:MAG: Rne/Rng family ribonuclease [Gaiellaceae bacterium]